MPRKGTINVESSKNRKNQGRIYFLLKKEKKVDVKKKTFFLQSKDRTKKH